MIRDVRRRPEKTVFEVIKEGTRNVRDLSANAENNEDQPRRIRRRSAAER